MLPAEFLVFGEVRRNSLNPRGAGTALAMQFYIKAINFFKKPY